MEQSQRIITKRLVKVLDGLQTRCGIDIWHVAMDIWMHAKHLQVDDGRAMEPQDILQSH